MAHDPKPSAGTPIPPPRDVAPAESPFPQPKLDITEKGIDPPGKETRDG